MTRYIELDCTVDYTEQIYRKSVGAPTVEYLHEIYTCLDWHLRKWHSPPLPPWGDLDHREVRWYADIIKYIACHRSALPADIRYRLTDPSRSRWRRWLNTLFQTSLCVYNFRIEDCMFLQRLVLDTYSAQSTPDVFRR